MYNMIKLLACIFMLIDHLGVLFFPQYDVLRVIGRLAMPFYAYCIARGIKYTKDYKSYLKRVLEISILTQIPFSIMLKEIKLNICFLWVIGIWFIVNLEKTKSIKRKIVLSVVIFFFVSLLKIDYGVYGLAYLTIIYFSLFKEKKNSDLYMYASWGILHFLKLIINFASGIIQVFTLPAIPIIDICNKYGLEKKQFNNKFIQYFYPIHLLILLIIYKAIS